MILEDYIPCSICHQPSDVSAQQNLLLPKYISRLRKCPVIWTGKSGPYHLERTGRWSTCPKSSWIQIFFQPSSLWQYFLPWVLPAGCWKAPLYLIWTLNRVTKIPYTEGWLGRFLTKLQIEVFLTIFSLVSLLYHQGLKRSGYWAHSFSMGSVCSSSMKEGGK